MSKISIAVCILFFEKLDQTLDCVHSFQREELNLYILNNGSSDASFEKLKKELISYNNISFFDSNKNLGCPGGRSFLIDNTNEEWLVFPDNDITVQPQIWYNVFTDAVAQSPETEVFVPKLFNVHEDCFASFNKLNLHGNLIVEQKSKEGENMNWFPGGASFIKRSLFRELGNYDSNLFCFEDYEFGVRMLLRNRKFKMTFLNDIIFRHDHKYMHSSIDKNAVKERYNAERIRSSLNYLKDKFDVEFDHEWQHWTTSQVALMTKSKKRKGFEKILNKVIGYLSYRR